MYDLLSEPKICCKMLIASSIDRHVHNHGHSTHRSQRLLALRWCLEDNNSELSPSDTERYHIAGEVQGHSDRQDKL